MGSRCTSLSVALLSVALLACFADPARADCADPFGEPGAILDLHLRTDGATWEAIRNGEVGDCGARIYQEVEFRCGDEEGWLRIGARRKVASGGRGDKPHLKLDLNRVVTGQGWPQTYGEGKLKKLNLLNGGGDPTLGDPPRVLLSEHVGLRLLAQEVQHSPASVYARLWLHLDGEPNAQRLGLYIVVEQVDGPFLRRRFGTDRGRLSKTSGQPCDGVRVDDGVGADLQLAEESLYRQVAVRDILGDQDTMWDKTRNFYRFETAMDGAEGGIDVTIPWDFDDAFSRLNSDAINPMPEDPELHMGMLCELINGSMSQTRLTEMVDRTHALIEADVEQERDRNAYLERLEHIRSEYIPTRIPMIRQQLQDAGFDCPEGCRQGEVRPCRLGPRCPGERACGDGLWGLCESPEPGCLPYARPVPAPPTGGDPTVVDAGTPAGAVADPSRAGDGAPAPDGSSSASDAMGDGGGCQCSARPAGSPGGLHALFAILWLARRRSPTRSRARIAAASRLVKKGLGFEVP